MTLDTCIGCGTDIDFHDVYYITNRGVQCRGCYEEITESARTMSTYEKSLCKILSFIIADSENRALVSAPGQGAYVNHVNILERYLKRMISAIETGSVEEWVGRIQEGS